MGRTTEKVFTYINNDGIPKNLILTSSRTSTECWCGAYKTEEDFKRLYDLDQDMFHKLAETEAKVKTGYTFLYKKKSRKRKSLKSLEKEILKNNRV